jgi:hypothetical protein
MVSNTDDIDKLDDGRMIASGWKGYTCKICDSYHIDFLDKAGETFATLCDRGRGSICAGRQAARHGRGSICPRWFS